MFVVKSRTFRDKIADKLSSEVTSSQLKSMISCSQVELTLIFQVNVTSTSPFASDVANTIAELAPDEIVRVLEASAGLKLSTMLSVPTSPSSPNLAKNILIGFAVAFSLAFIIFFTKELFDTRITRETDLTKDFDIPVLGTVPRLLPVEAKKESINGATMEQIAKQIDLAKKGE